MLSATRQRSPPRLHPSRVGWYSIYRPRKDERLSWPSWLVTYRNGLPVHRRVTHPSTNRVWRSATTLIEANALPLSQTANLLSILLALESVFRPTIHCHTIIRQRELQLMSQGVSSRLHAATLAKPRYQQSVTDLVPRRPCKVTAKNRFLHFCQAMLCKRGLSRHAVSVCPSVTFVDSVETNKHVFKLFSPSGSHTTLVFA